MQTKKRLNKRGGLAISQIFILIFGIIAISYAVGSEVRVVRGFGGDSIEQAEEMSSSPGPTDITGRADLSKITTTGGVTSIAEIVKKYPEEIQGELSETIDNFMGGATTGIQAGSYGDWTIDGNVYEEIIHNVKEGSYLGINKEGKTFFISPKRLEEMDFIDNNGRLIDPKNVLTGTTVGDWLFQKGYLKSQGSANFVGHIASGFMWAVTAYGVTKMLGGMLGVDEPKVDAASKAAFWGILSGKTTYGLIKEGGWLSKTDWGKWLTSKFPGGVTGISIGIGIIVAVIIFYNMYKSESQETITFTCNSWQAPTGGSHCEKCNKQGALPCSEYQCRSLGQACQLLNPGTEEVKCVWVNRGDVKFPIIKPWDEALLDDYQYKPDNTISPPDTGVIIFNKQSTTGCVKAFTPLTFGVILDEPAQCKIDYLRKSSFDEMDYYFGGSTLFRYNHTQIMSLPGPSALESINMTLYNDGNYEIYTRCQDANGNKNTANFVFKFCVEKGPDTTPPLIVTTNLLNNMPIAYNQTSVDLEVYTNEPATCKWSHVDQNYEDMEETMSCSSSVLEMNAQMLYKCTTILTGIKNNIENKFYFRCEDQPIKPKEDRNVNSESYEFMLIGTQPLVITEIGPNGTIKDSTEIIKVTLEAKTSAGYKEGEAKCYYSDTGEDDSYIMFFNTDSHEHTQDLHLAEGDYEYWIKCIDLGGNSDTNKTEFKVESDLEAPIVVRAYHEESYLKLITNEEAECVYDTTDCNYLFDDGIKITVVDETKHFADWNTKIDFYIKCKDEYGNQPMPNKCSIIARPFEIDFE